MKILLTTIPPGVGATLLRQLIDEELVPGGNIIPGVRSIYRWKGDIHDEAEEILLVPAADVSAVERRILKLHPYEVPQVLVLGPERPHIAFAAWVNSQGFAPG